MSSSDDSRGTGSGYSSGGNYVNLQENMNIQPATISSSLQCIPYQKLTNLEFINKGAYGTVHRACHSDWRVEVAVKFFPTERHLVERERNKILKEAEILHKARFSYILPVLGICNEVEYLGIVTEYMPNGSLNQLLHEEDPSLEIVWPLRFRILYEIALGVNFLHNMTPSLLHHDLKTQNILLDNEFHVKIADFGLSKWRMLSSSQSFSDQSPPGGTIVYMPPEEYDLSIKNKRGSVKHDMYSYAIIMWEVLSRRQPYEGATTPMQIMFSVSNGMRPDLSDEYLPFDIPHRAVFISLMKSGWANDPNDRPAFLKCLLELEPVVRNYDEILILEGILQIKRVKHCVQHNSISSLPTTPYRSPVPELQFRSSNEDVHDRTNGEGRSHNEDTIPSSEPFPQQICEESIEWKKIPYETVNNISTPHPIQESPSSPLQWIRRKRNEIINQMTEACLNQCLDSLISNMVILKEDYELIKSQSTRSSKVRQLIDTCDAKGDAFARVIVQKLKENRQNDLQPFPEI